MTDSRILKRPLPALIVLGALALGGCSGTHAAIYNTFNVQRRLITRKTMRQFRGDAMNTWRTVTAAA